jgi:sec-independent protein translocase protein TatA
MNLLLGLIEPGMGQIILIILVVLLLFGAKKLPELAKGIGQGIKEFKKATRDVQSDIHSAVNETEEYRPAPPPAKPAPPAEQKPQTPTT